MAKASIQAVAKEAGVSVSTVSRTFAKPNLVLPKTRDRVLAAARKLDFQVSRSAAALKSGQSFRIALLHADTIAVWFNANVFRGLNSVFGPAGYDRPYTACRTRGNGMISSLNCRFVAMWTRSSSARSTSTRMRSVV